MILTWPDFPVGAFRWHLQQQQAVFTSQFGRQAIAAAAPLWRVSITGLSETRDDARKIALFLDRLDGFANQLELWNIEHPVPAGSMRGDMVFYTFAAQGSKTITLRSPSGNAGKTLLAGDYIGFGKILAQQVVQVTEDAVADINGIITVSVNPPLRNAFAIGSEITWNMPKALFRLGELTQGMEMTPDGANPWEISLVEDWRV